MGEEVSKSEESQEEEEAGKQTRETSYGSAIVSVEISMSISKSMPSEGVSGRKES